MKKLGILFVTVIMIMLFAMSASAKTIVDSGECGAEGDNVTWVLYDDGELVIDGTGAMRDYDEAHYISLNPAPWYNLSKDVKKVIISSGITKIGEHSFMNCYNVKEVEMPDTVTEIGMYAFSGCDITEIELSANLKTIGDRAFEDSSLNYIVIPKGTTSIGNSVFCDCYYLKTVVLPDSLQKLGYYVFDCMTYSPIVNNMFYVGIIDIYYEGTSEQWKKVQKGESDLYDFASMNYVYGTHFHIRDAIGKMDADCTGSGYITFVCSCGFYKIGLPAEEHQDYDEDNKCNECNASIDSSTHIHKYTETIDVAPTCTELGEKTYTCSCGDVYNEDIFETRHYNATFNEGKEPTETETGYTAGKYCPDCKTWIEGHVEIPKAEAHTHSYTYLITKTPTCTTSGTKVFTCTCGDSYTESIPATNHPNAIIDAGRAPTETETGYTAGKYCPDCKTWIEGHTEIPKLDTCQHTTTNGQCNKCKAFVIEEGETHRIEYTGLSNGLWYTESDIVALEDKASSYIYENGNFYYHLYVTLKGMKKGTAEVLVLDARGFILAKAKVVVTEHVHMYDQKEIPGTCIAEKEIVYTCTCGDKRSEKGDKDPLNHTGNQKTINQVLADCINEGYTGDIYCEDCNTLISEGVKEVALGHDFAQKTTVAPTCTTEGSTVYGCSRCEETETETIPATNHPNAITDTGKAPTTTEVGYTAGKYCPDCETWLEGHEEIPMLHTHSYTPTVTKEATCWRDGETTYTCSCGDSYTEAIAKLDHEYRPWETKKNPTCTASGLEWSYCLICDNDFEREIPATRHTIIDYTRRATPDSDGAYVTACDVCNEVFKSISFGRPTEYKLSTTKYTYDGKTKTPKLTVETSDGVVLKEGTDYEIELPTGRKAVGVYTYRVVFKGDFLGEKKVSYQILPGKTSKITATQSTSAIKLTWKKVTGATGYRVYQYNSKTGKYEKIKTLTGTSYTVKNLKAGTTYKFAIRAYAKIDGEVLWSTSNVKLSTCTKPGATSEIKHSLSADSVKISWKSVTGATGYRVYIRNNSKWEKLITTKSNSFVYVVSENIKDCTFAVKAYKKLDGKNYWADSSTKISVTLYPGVTEKITYDADYNAVSLEWKKVPRATGYRIYKWNSKLDKWDIVVKGTEKLSVRMVKLEAGKSYTFAVRAYIKIDGECLWSESYKKIKTSTDKLNGRINILQIHSSWSDKIYGKMTLGDSGCGVVSIVNAVYNLNGKFIDPREIADWAYKNKYYNRGGDGGAMLELVPQVCKKFGDKYGFRLVATYTNYGTLKSSSSARKALIKHIENGGVAVAHVYYHYLAIVDYDANTGKFLVFDSYPGSYYGKDTGSRRYGYTTQKGDWKTAAELSVYPLDLDRFYLISAK